MTVAPVTSTVDIDLLPCGIVCVNDMGGITFVNRYLCELLGSNREDLVDTPLESMFTVSAKIFYHTHFFPLVKLHNKAEEVFFSLRSRSGDHIPVIAYASRTGDQMQFVFVPVKQRRKYEEEILQAKRTAETALQKNEALTSLKHQVELQLAESDRQLSLLKQFNSEYIELNKIISHDLHEPIRKLMVHIDLLLKDDVAPGEKITNSLTKMMQFCTRLRHLTICLQQYVSIDTSKEPHQAFALADVVRNAFAAAVQSENYNDTLFVVSELPVIEGYRSQIERMFYEVFSNSLRFRREDEPLHIAVTSTEFSDNIYKEIRDKYRYINFVRVDVTDNGAGFPNEYSDYIFGLFKRARLDKEGSGFGLAISKKIAERHNGSITAKSFDGKTTFSILLPLRQSEVV